MFRLKIFKTEWLPYLSLSLVPFVYLVVGFMYIHSQGLYFLKSVDPEYAYLFNGLLMARLDLAVPHIDHPGTPVQCVAAVLLRFMYLFRGGEDLTADVMKNPEIYLRGILYTLNVLNALAIGLMGFFTSRYLLPGYGIFLQVTPFAHLLPLEITGRVMPESLMTLLAALWMVLIIRKVFRPAEVKPDRGYPLLFGFLFGLSLADKLTFLPFFLLPLFLLLTWKSRLLYLMFGTLSFFIFAFPVTLRIKVFYDWVSRLFIHTGTYGSGDTGIIQLAAFKANLFTQYQHTRLLFYSALVLLLVSVLYVLLARKRQQSALMPRAGLGLSVVVLFMYVLAAKHFSYHYMVPALLLTLLANLFSVLMMASMLPTKGRVYAAGVLALIAAVVFAANLKQALKQVGQIKENVQMRMEAYHAISPLLSEPLVVCPDYYGCASPVYALTFGIHVSGQFGTELTRYLNRMYPETYLFFPWSKSFFQGNRQVPAKEVMPAHSRMNLYLAPVDSSAFQAMLDSLSLIESKEIRLLKKTQSGDQLYLIH